MEVRGRRRRHSDRETGAAAPATVPVREPAGSGCAETHARSVLRFRPTTKRDESFPRRRQSLGRIAVAHDGIRGGLHRLHPARDRLHDGVPDGGLGVQPVRLHAHRVRLHLHSLPRLAVARAHARARLHRAPDRGRARARPGARSRAAIAAVVRAHLPRLALVHLSASSSSTSTIRLAFDELRAERGMRLWTTSIAFPVGFASPWRSSSCATSSAPRRCTAARPGSPATGPSSKRPGAISRMPASRLERPGSSKLSQICRAGFMDESSRRLPARSAGVQTMLGGLEQVPSA